MSRYFGTNGVRGKFNELTPELALKIAHAIGIYFNKGKIVIARDGRLTGEIIQNAASAGLMSVGCEVVDLGFASAPTAEFMIKKLRADGCIIVTASHNPPEWNALKVVDKNGISISRERGEEIEKIMENIEHAKWDSVGNISKYENAAEDHINAIKKFVDLEKIKQKKPKIVLDCGNGMSALIAPKMLSEFGAEVVSINDNVDGRFPGRPSEPKKENVKQLIETVKKQKADAGIAWDGDGDRVIFVDENGEYVIGDKVYALCVLWKLAKQKGDVVTTVATSKAVEDVAKTQNCKMIYTKIGAPYLSEEVAKGKAVMGGEEVGGVIWPEISLAKDGILTAAKLVDAVCEKPVSKWLEQVPEYYNVKKTIKADSEKKKQIVENMQSYANKQGLEHISIDGVRINLADGWIIVRASGTENYVRIFSEAKTKQKAEQIMDEYLRIIENKG